MSKKTFFKDYPVFVFITLASVLIAVVISIYFSFEKDGVENSKNLEKSAKNIDVIITELFDYTNQINSYIGKEIAASGATNLKVILALLNEADKIKVRNNELFSWSALDWVDSKNYQVVNSRIGINKNPPNMSFRYYVQAAAKNPWTLQISPPDLGIPSQSWIIPAGTGVANKDGKYLGIISLGFNIAQIADKITKRINEKVSFVILDQDLNIIVKSIDIDLERNSNFFQKKISPKIFDAESGFLKKQIKIGDINLGYYRKISKYPYIILTGFDKNIFAKQFAFAIFPRLLELICIAVFFLIILHLFKVRISLLERENLLISSLEKTNKAKDQILFSIAHDIKNQIFGINGLAKMIIDKKTKSEISADEDLQIAEIISDQSEEMMEFVKDLLDGTRIEGGEFSLGKIKEYHVKPLIEGLVMINGSFAASHNVKLSTIISDNIPTLKCDLRRIKQLLNNLINNAIKYSYAGGEVVIAVKYLEQTSQICIEIIDQGYGMTEKEISKYLSGKGSEIDKSEIAKDKTIDSHGIGMPIVLKLIELHFGKISVESKKGKGTKIRIYFDLNKLNSEFETNQTDELEKITKTKNLSNFSTLTPSILLVEDNPVNIKITKRVLESYGYKVHYAENGKEALEILDQEKFDLILMDGEMPVMNGYETTQAIRRGDNFKNFKNYKQIPIIALMSSSDDVTIKKALASGMNGHVEKSTSKTKLLEMVEKYTKST